MTFTALVDANVEAREIAMPKYGIFGPGWEKYIYV